MVKTSLIVLLVVYAFHIDIVTKATTIASGKLLQK